jgi:hypothetical protein
MMKNAKILGTLILVLAFIAACFYFDYWAFKKIHPEAGIGLWLLDCAR